MSTAEHVSVDVREVTADEIREYEQNGWAILRRPVTPETAADLLAVVRGPDGRARRRADETPATARNLEAFAKWYNLDEESELFHALRHNRQLGRIARC